MNIQYPSRWFCLLLCAAGLTSSSASAQSANPAPDASPHVPSPPWVATPPDSAQWRITVKPAKDDASPTPKPDPKNSRQLKQVLCEKQGSVKRDIRIYSDGSTEEYWYTDGLELRPAMPGSTHIMISSASSGPNTDFEKMVDPVSSPGFAGVGWIKAADYRDTIQYMGVKCDHFARDKEGWEAWIDADTKLPVAFKAEDALYVYSFEQPTAFAMPSAYQHVYDNYHKQILHTQQLMKDLGGQ